MAQRPGTQARQATAGGQRLATAAQRGGGGGSNPGRPMTRGGLGLKTGATGGRNRAVMDKSYFMGVLRTKISEMNAEIRRMATESGKMGKDQEAFVIYDTRAKEKAAELAGIQGELADYNMLVEIMNMDSEKKAVDEQQAAMFKNNEEDRKVVDSLYLTRKKKEDECAQCDKDIVKEQAVIDKVFNSMSASMKKQFEILKKKAAATETEIQELSKEMDDEELKIRKNMEIINASTMKKEAYGLYNKLEELELKKEELQEQVNKQETPDEERERLLREVKEDNDAIASMERQVTAMCEEVSNTHDQLDDMDDSDSSSDDESAGDPLQAQKGPVDLDPEVILKQMGDAKSDEERKVLEQEAQIVTVLQKMGAALKVDTDKTADQGLADNEEWQQVTEVERQVYSEMDFLKNSIKKMQVDAAKFADLDGFKKECQVRQGDLHKEHVTCRENVKKAKAEYSTAENLNKKMEKELHGNETFAKLEQQERKLASLLGNNFQLLETSADRRATGEYEPIRDQSLKICADLNSKLMDMIKNKKIPT